MVSNGAQLYLIVSNLANYMNMYVAQLVVQVMCAGMVLHHYIQWYLCDCIQLVLERSAGTKQKPLLNT